jgi:hypothetical protein
MSALGHRLFRDSMRTAVASLGYHVPTDSRGLSVSWGLKERILSGHSDNRILNDDRFEASLSADNYFEALRFAWRYGYVRCHRQLLAAKDGADRTHVPTAWILVTAYYASFFAAVELLRAAGIWMLFLTDDEAAVVLESDCGGSGCSVSSGIYIGRVTWIQPEGVHRIRFSRGSGGMHAHVWKEIAQVLRAKTQISDVDERLEFDRFAGFLGCGQKAWGTLSETRNQWNYQRADFYGSLGKGEGAVLRKILRDESSAYGWARTRKLCRSTSSEAAAVGYAMFVLREVVEHTARIILPSGDLSRLSQGG